MAIARIVNGEIKEVREDIDIQDIPPHKRSIWRPVVDDPPALLVKHSRAIRGNPVLKNNQVEYDYTIVVDDLQNLITNEAFNRIGQNVLIDKKNIGLLAFVFAYLDKKETKTTEEQEMYDSILALQEYMYNVLVVSKNLKEVDAENYDTDEQWPALPQLTDKLEKLIGIKE